MKNIRSDYSFQFGHNPRLRNLLSAFVFFPGFRASIMMRMQMSAQNRGLQRWALLFSNLNHMNTGAEICVGAQIGVPIILRHPSGIVIGGGVKIGAHCTILQGVTIGEKYVQNPDGMYPVIGDSVQIGCNSSILGKVIVGSNSVIGAHALILKDVEDGEVAFGLH
jgi:serine O-acetyltransferase